MSCHWRELLRLCQPAINGAVAEARAWGRDPFDAESIAYELTMKAIHRWQPDGRASFRWYLRVCLRRVKQRADSYGAIRLPPSYRRKHRTIEAARRTFNCVPLPAIIAVIDDPASRLVSAEREAALCRALMQLKPSERETIKVWCRGGGAAVAAMRGSGKRTSQKRVRRALQRLSDLAGSRPASGENHAPCRSCRRRAAVTAAAS